VTDPGTTADDAEARRWVDAHREGASADEALAFFDRLPPASPDGMLGRWRGSGLPTGSPLDGLLETYGWYGKEFVDAETAHPLLFRDRAGRPRPVDPELLPVGLLRDRAGLVHHPLARSAFSGVRPLLFTRKPKARLRALEYRGVVTAAMIYDALPIIDVFRRVDDDMVLGFMDMRGLPDPFFFLLERDEPPVSSAPAG
jgi:hypothetical protein